LAVVQVESHDAAPAGGQRGSERRQQRRLAATVRPDNLPPPTVGSQAIDQTLDAAIGRKEVRHRAWTDVTRRKRVVPGLANGAVAMTNNR
jgi:hypothetical protein